eukprot:scaffold2483_cov135-Isochrysis_galbana.AAC.8
MGADNHTQIARGRTGRSVQAVEAHAPWAQAAGLHPTFGSAGASGSSASGSRSSGCSVPHA